MEMEILPHILATLSRKPGRSDFVDGLCDEVQDILAADYPDTRVTQIRKAIKQALKVAQGLGVISIGGEKIRLPFKLGGQQSPAIDEAVDVVDEGMDASIDDDSMDDDEDNATNKTSLRKRAPLAKDNSQLLTMGPRKLVGKSNTMAAMDRMGRKRSARARRPRRGRASSHGRASSRGRVSRRRVSRRRR